MKILYGIQGVGNGHITRSLRVIEEIESLGHSVNILISGNSNSININRGVDFRFRGFNFGYNKNGKISIPKTLMNSNFKDLIRGSKIDLKNWDLVISDFEPITAWVGMWQGVDITGISNQYSFISNKTPRPDKKEFLSEFVIDNFAPVANPIGIHYDNYDDFIFTPILRKEILEANPINLDYYLVYLPNKSLESIVYMVKEYTNKFIVYHPDIKWDYDWKNIGFRRIDSSRFLKTFIECSGIITSSGFGSTSEAIHLGKKIFSIPTVGQYEQECNNAALKKLGIRYDSLDEFIKSDHSIKILYKDPIKDILNKIGI